MALTIPDLTAAIASALTDLIEVSQSGVSKKETLQQVLTLFNANAQLASASQVTGLGTAATKAISDSGLSTVAGVSGTLGSGDIARFTSAADGTIETAGFTSAQVTLNINNLNDMADPYSCSANIHASQNNGESQPNLTGADVVLSNPAPTVLNITNNNGTTALWLPPPVDTDGKQAWQVGQIVLFDNKTGSNAVPIKDANGAGIITLAASSAYLMYVVNTAGNVSFVKVL